MCVDPYVWSEMFGDNGVNDANGIHGVGVDSAGNVVFTGSQYGTVDYGGGPLSDSSPGSSLSVGKLDPTGKYVWAANYAGTSTRAYGSALAIDPSDNVVVAGSHLGDLTIGSTIVSNNGGSAPLGDLFVAKFDKLGHPKWGVNGTSGGGGNVALAVATDGAGDIVVAGAFGGSTAFSGTTAVPSAGSTDIVLAKIHADSTTSWVKVFGDPSAQSGTGVAVDAMGNVILAAVSLGPLNFGGGALPYDGGQDAYLAKFDSLGNHLWSKQFGGLANTGTAMAVATDPSGNIVVAGTFAGSINLGGGALASAGSTDFFVAKLDSTGAYQWGKRFGDMNAQPLIRLAVDATGAILLHGSFQGTVDFGGGPLVSTGGATMGPNLFVAKLDGAGNHLWSRRFGDSYANEAFGGVAVAPGGGVVVGGYFEGVLDFSGMNPMTNLGFSSAYVAKLVTP
jgi:hypothetical protein